MTIAVRTLALVAAVVLLFAALDLSTFSPRTSDRLLAHTRINFYGDGLSFGALGQAGNFHAVGCTRHAGAAVTQCPVTLHLTNGDVTADDIADPSKLKARGWIETASPARDTVQYYWRDGGMVDERAMAVAVYTNGALHTLAFRSFAGHDVTVRGRRLRLPINEPALELAMGVPEKRQRYDALNGIQ